MSDPDGMVSKFGDTVKSLQMQIIRNDSRFKELNDTTNVRIEDMKKKLRDKMEYNAKMIEQKLAQLHMMVTTVQSEGVNISNQGMRV